MNDTPSYCPLCGKPITSHMEMCPECQNALNKECSSYGIAVDSYTPENNQNKLFPSILQTIGLLVVLEILMLIVGFGLGFLSGSVNLSLYDTTWYLIALTNTLSISAILFWGYKVRNESWTEFLQLSRFTTNILIPLVFIAIGLSIVTSELINLLIYIFPIPVYNDGFFSDFALTGFGAVLLLVIVAPFTEEFLFRGFVLRAFLTRHGTKTAVIVSAVLFAIFHLNLMQLIPAFTAGLLLGWVYVYTRSIWPCIFLHALFNSIGLIVTDILRVDIPGYTTWGETAYGATIFQPLWFDILGIVLLSLGIWLFTKVKSYDKKPDASIFDSGTIKKSVPPPLTNPYNFTSAKDVIPSEGKAWYYWLGVVLLSISALFWLLFTIGAVESTEDIDIGYGIFGGIVITGIPIGAGIFCIVRGNINKNGVRSYNFICPACKGNVSDEWTFCPHCKERLIEYSCVACGKAIEEDFKVCPHCGQVFDE